MALPREAGKAIQIRALGIFLGQNGFTVLQRDLEA